MSKSFVNKALLGGAVAAGAAVGGDRAAFLLR